jgi:mRNA interferase MazF
VILQTDDLSHLNTVVIIPLTAQIRHAGSTHTVLIPAMEAGQSLDSVVLCHQVRALDRRKLIHKIGEMPPERLSEIEVCIMFVFGLPS